jgi:hypothetical protein
MVMTSAWCVSRSMSVTAHAAFGKTVPHCLKGRFVGDHQRLLFVQMVPFSPMRRWSFEGAVSNLLAPRSASGRKNSRRCWRVRLPGLSTAPC